jgi:pimeloyl-ACP methyl ester carboxylesterase
MKRHVLWLALILAGMFCFWPQTAAAAPLNAPTADPQATCDPEGTQSNGSKYLICVPPNWNGTLLIYAHGYIAPDEPIANVVTLPDGTSIVDALQFFGYGFATSSYSRNGLAVLDGIESLIDLVSIFRQQRGEPSRIYLIGVSQGGLVATLAAERRPDVFDGGLALCGPYGDFQRQADYYVDVRVVFDYFFPDLLVPFGGSAVDIPNELFVNWSSVYSDTVKPALLDPNNRAKVDQLLAVTAIPAADDQIANIVEAIEDVLWYNVKGTNDAVTTLGGQPFGNQDRVYTGSANDDALNQQVARFTADPTALTEIAVNYQASGYLQVPLVTLHTTRDPVVPYQQVDRYRERVAAQGRSAYYDAIGVDVFGHCNFQPLQALNALQRLEALDAGLADFEFHEVYLPSIKNE